ncbi:adenylyl-sulfate kinase [Methylobacterium tardum]|nr:adenylyl-sulfate kinase [Methylobacterium tardum]URD37956.1 adenylyl-sulfate kinase [Methylobacterium tardum]
MPELSADEINHNLTRHALLPREERWRRLGQRPAIAWLTGLSGAGKSSIANAVDRALTQSGRHTMVVDGDNLRLGLNRDLGFSAADRAENIRRAAEAARLMAEAGIVVIVSLISPFREERAAARQIAGDIPFFEAFIDTPLRICEERDPKGLYSRARAGLIPDFTGISAPYEPPEKPDLVVRTEGCTAEQSAAPLASEMMRVSAPELACIDATGTHGLDGIIPPSAA